MFFQCVVLEKETAVFRTKSKFPGRFCFEDCHVFFFREKKSFSHLSAQIWKPASHRLSSIHFQVRTHSLLVWGSSFFMGPTTLRKSWAFQLHLPPVGAHWILISFHWKGPFRVLSLEIAGRLRDEKYEAPLSLSLGLGPYQGWGWQGGTLRFRWLDTNVMRLWNRDWPFFWPKAWNMLTEKQRQHNAITCVMSMKCEAVLFGKECSRMFFFAKIPKKKHFFFTFSLVFGAKMWRGLGSGAGSQGLWQRTLPQWQRQVWNVGTQSSKQPLDLNRFKTRLWSDPRHDESWNPPIGSISFQQEARDPTRSISQLGWMKFSLWQVEAFSRQVLGAVFWFMEHLQKVAFLPRPWWELKRMHTLED